MSKINYLKERLDKIQKFNLIKKIGMNYQNILENFLMSR